MRAFFKKASIFKKKERKDQAPKNDYCNEDTSFDDVDNKNKSSIEGRPAESTNDQQGSFQERNPDNDNEIEIGISNALCQDKMILQGYIKGISSDECHSSICSPIALELKDDTTPKLSTNTLPNTLQSETVCYSPTSFLCHKKTSIANDCQAKMTKTNEVQYKRLKHSYSTNHCYMLQENTSSRKKKISLPALLHQGEPLIHEGSQERVKEIPKILRRKAISIDNIDQQEYISEKVKIAVAMNNLKDHGLL